MTSSRHAYEVRSRKDHRGADLISYALPFGRDTTEMPYRESPLQVPETYSAFHRRAQSNACRRRDVRLGELFLTAR